LNGTNDDPKPEGLAKRVQHPVAWQCIDGELTISDDIKEHLQVGLFKKPGNSFPVSIRTSHNNFDADSDPKISSIAVKVHADGLGPWIDISDYPQELQDLNSHKQDFVFVSTDFFPFGDRVIDSKYLLE